VAKLFTQYVLDLPWSCVDPRGGLSFLYTQGSRLDRIQQRGLEYKGPEHRGSGLARKKGSPGKGHDTLEYQKWGVCHMRKARIITNFSWEHYLRRGLGLSRTVSFQIG